MQGRRPLVHRRRHHRPDERVHAADQDGRRLQARADGQRQLRRPEAGAQRDLRAHVGAATTTSRRRLHAREQRHLLLAPGQELRLGHRRRQLRQPRARSPSCGGCGAPEICGGSGQPNVCAPRSTSYEGEASVNTFGGSAIGSTCAEAFPKFGDESSTETAAGACSGGSKVRYLGNNSSNHVTINNVNVARGRHLRHDGLGLQRRTRATSTSASTAARPRP